MEYKKVALVIPLLLVLLLSGCINMEVSQKLKRSGHYDMELTISTGQEYKMMLNAFKESIRIDDSVKERFRYNETDTSITYSFKEIDPQTDKKLFKEIQSDDQQDTLGGMKETADSSFIDPKNIEFKKELKFPYYVFTYALKTIAKSSETDDDLAETDDDSEFDMPQIEDNLGSTDTIESKKMIDSLGKLFMIGYTVEVFGEITETNGLKMDDNKVKFTINPWKDGTYRVVFKDFFLATILGDNWAYILSIGVVLLGGAIFVSIRKLKKRQNEKIKKIKKERK